MSKKKSKKKSKRKERKRKTINNRNAVILETEASNLDEISEKGYRLFPTNKTVFENRNQAEEYLKGGANKELLNKTFIIALLDKEVSFIKPEIKTIVKE